MGMLWRRDLSALNSLKIEKNQAFGLDVQHSPSSSAGVQPRRSSPVGVRAACTEPGVTNPSQSACPGFQGALCRGSIILGEASG